MITRRQFMKWAGAVGMSLATAEKLYPMIVGVLEKFPPESWTNFNPNIRYRHAVLICDKSVRLFKTDIVKFREKFRNGLDVLRHYIKWRIPPGYRDKVVYCWDVEDHCGELTMDFYYQPLGVGFCYQPDGEFIFYGREAPYGKEETMLAEIEKYYKLYLVGSF